MAEVRVQEGESIENALRRFKRKVQTEDIIKEVKRHSYYLKPGERRRVKQALARKRARKKIRREGSFSKDTRRNNQRRVTCVSKLPERNAPATRFAILYKHLSRQSGQSPRG